MNFSGHLTCTVVCSHLQFHEIVINSRKFKSSFQEIYFLSCGNTVGPSYIPNCIPEYQSGCNQGVIIITLPGLAWLAYRWGQTDVTSGYQHLRAIKKMLESLNGSVPALQADSHGIQIHGTPAPPYIFNHCRPGCVARATKTNVFIGKLFLLGPLTESTRMTTPTYRLSKLCITLQLCLRAET